MTTARRTYPHDPDARLDYYFDWKARTNGTGDSDWLADGETITNFEVTAASLTVDQPVAAAVVNGDTAVQVWVSVPEDTASGRYPVACKIATSAGRIDERTLFIDVYDR